jgi:hypothetical protein
MLSTPRSNAITLSPVTEPAPPNGQHNPPDPTWHPSGAFHLDQMANPSRRRCWPWIIATVLVFALGAAVVWASTRPEPAPATSTKPTIAAAHSACEEAVELQLKAPGSATFGGREESAANVEIPIRVSGYVDAQNSFGALVRNRYSCLATPSGSTWTITDVSLSDWP